MSNEHSDNLVGKKIFLVMCCQSVDSIAADNKTAKMVGLQMVRQHRQQENKTTL